MKGIVVINGNETVIRFLARGAFRDMERRHDLLYALINTRPGYAEQELAADGVARRAERVPYYANRFRRWQELFDLSCVRFRALSPSFQVRYEEYIRKDAARCARLEADGQPESYRAAREKAEQSMGCHPGWLALFQRERPDFVVVPTALLDHSTDDILQVAELLRLPVLLLVAGWDNLSSKGLLYHHPAMLAVWGPQSKEHAVAIQNMDPDRIRLVGAPQYDDYRRGTEEERLAARRQLGLPEQGRAVLFAGTFRHFDETSLLLELEECIEAGTLPPFHVLYRPHPWRAKREQEQNFYDRTWRHVTMDPTLVEQYRQAKERNEDSSPAGFVFEMQHLRDVYRAVDAVISPMSTVLLESMLNGRPVMAVAFSDGKHSWSADKVSRMMHFKELYEIPEVLVCRDRAAFAEQVRTLVERIGVPALEQAIERATGYFVMRDERPYAARAAAVLDEMLARCPRPDYDAVRVPSGRTLHEEPWRARLMPRRVVAKLKRLVGWS